MADVESSEDDDANTGQVEAADSTANPAKRIAIFVVVLLLALVVLYALTDQMAPSTSRGIVSAHVAQIAPRVAGEVVEVLVDDDAVVEAGMPLFTLDPHPFELATRQAEAKLKSALQGVDASSASLIAAQATVTQARGSARQRPHRD